MYQFASTVFVGAFLGFTFAALVLAGLLFWGNKAWMKNLEKPVVFFYTLVTLLLTVTVFFLLYAFVYHDFIVQYVAQYSDRTLPLFYRITALWAGQSGSLLFWAWSVALSGLIFAWLPTYKGLSTATKLWYWIFFFCIMAFFLLLLCVWSDPFALRDSLPEDGQGLNPMLQSMGMIFHPPLLFWGYGGFVVPGCLALAQAMSGNLYAPQESAPSEQHWEEVSRPFILIAWALLTAGIILGAWWAYMELGWGGYWAWDPVENASIIPWLAASAYLHTSVIGSRRGKLPRTNVFLMALTTISAFFATYLVRSGVVQSVHAFGYGGVGAPLLIFILASLLIVLFVALYPYTPETQKPFGTIRAVLSILVGCILAVILYCAIAGTTQATLLLFPLTIALIGVFFAGASPHPQAKPLEDLFSKEGLLLLVAWILLTLAALILIATLWPVFIKTLDAIRPYLPAFLAVKVPANQVGLDAAFYNRTCLPLFAFLSVLLMICPHRKWKLHAKESGFIQKKVFFAALGVAFASGIFLVFIGIHHPTALLAATCSLAALSGIVLFFANPSLFSAYSTLAAHGTHIGLLVVVIGIAFSGPYQEKYTLQLARKQTGTAGNYWIILNELYQGYSQIGSTGIPNYTFVEAELLVAKADGTTLGKLIPQRRLYSNFEQQVYAEVSTLFSLGNEIYATLLGIDGPEGEEYAVLAIYVFPLVNWLWIGGVLMCLFPLVGLRHARRRKNDYAPAKNGSCPKSEAPETKKRRGRE